MGPALAASGGQQGGMLPSGKETPCGTSALRSTHSLFVYASTNEQQPPCRKQRHQCRKMRSGCCPQVCRAGTGAGSVVLPKLNSKLGRD